MHACCDSQGLAAMHIVKPTRSSHVEISSLKENIQSNLSICLTVLQSKEAR